MNPEEFLWTADDEVTMPVLRDAFEARRSLGGGVHETALDRYREYLMVGWMTPRSSTAYNATDANAALAMSADDSTVKLYSSDTGFFWRSRWVIRPARRANSIMRSIPEASASTKAW